MMGSTFDGMEIVVDVILEVRSRTELGTTRGMDQVSVGSRATVVGLPRSCSTWAQSPDARGAGEV